MAIKRGFFDRDPRVIPPDRILVVGGALLAFLILNNLQNLPSMNIVQATDSTGEQTTVQNIFVDRAYLDSHSMNASQNQKPVGVPVESSKEKIAYYSEEFAHIQDRALAAENGDNIHDEMIIRAYLDPENKHRDEAVSEFTNNDDRVRILSEYHLAIETNQDIARMIDVLRPTKDPINRLLTKTMRPQDFNNGKIPQMTDFTLERGIFDPGLSPMWGGGLSGDNKSNMPITIFGP